jgi:hypothetical protein
MAWLLREFATLIAIYSIALQAILWGFRRRPSDHQQKDNELG